MSLLTEALIRLSAVASVGLCVGVEHGPWMGFAAMAATWVLMPQRTR